MKQEDIHKELIEIAPLLSSIPNENNQHVPEDYFEKVPNTTWNKILESKREDSSKVYSIFYKAIAFAASFAVLFFIMQSINDVNQLPDEIPMDALVDFVLDDLENIDESLLFDLHASSLDLIESQDDNLDYILDEGLDVIDDNFLETLY